MVLSISFHGMDPRSLQEKMFSLNPALSEVVHPRHHKGSCTEQARQGGAKAKPSTFICVQLWSSRPQHKKATDLLERTQRRSQK